MLFPALEALIHALDTAPELASAGAQGSVAFLGARPHDGLARFAGRITFEQPHKQLADRLTAAGHPVVRRVEGVHSLVLLLPERQKDLTLADLARGMSLLEPGGILLASLPNDWGAARFEKQLGTLAGNLCHLSKHKSRAFWAVKADTLDAALSAEWTAAAAPQKILDGRFWSQPGLFGWDRIDAGSQLLVDHLPMGLHGRAADLGGGYGFLGDFLCRHRPHLQSLDVFESDRRALEACQKNLDAIPPPFRLACRWHDVLSGVGSAVYDLIVMNPPFHEGRQSAPRLGLAFITNAAEALRPGGQLWMVANAHLQYETMLKQVLTDVRLVAQSNGFKVLTATRGVAAAVLGE